MEGRQACIIRHDWYSASACPGYAEKRLTCFSIANLQLQELVEYKSQRMVELNQVLQSLENIDIISNI